jgi:integrase
MQVVDRNGKQRMRTSGTTDHTAALRLANKWEADEALRREGVIDANLEAMTDQGKQSIESHLIDFENSLRVRGSSAQHVTSTLQKIRTICRLGKINIANELTPERVNAAAVILAREGCESKIKRHSFKPMGRCAIAHYLTAIKALAKWLSLHGRLPSNTLTVISKPNSKTDRRHSRRMLLPDEWQWLKTAAEQAGDRSGMTGRERMLLYVTAIYTGFRSAELRSLTRAQLHLGGALPYIICKGDATKNGDDAKQYIKTDLAAELAEFAATKHPKALLFDLPHHTELARMLRADLADARKAWLKAASAGDRMAREQSDFLLPTNHAGDILDFHSLRHTCGAWLAKAGVYPKVVQAVMRHSTITLTMDTYGHLFPGTDSEAIDRLPDLCSANAVPMQCARGKTRQNRATRCTNAQAV